VTATVILPLQKRVFNMMTSAYHNDDLIVRLQEWNLKWCQEDDHGAETSATDNKIPQTPLDLAVTCITETSLQRDAISQIFSHLLNVLRSNLVRDDQGTRIGTPTTATVDDGTTSSENTANNAKRKLKQIQWHVTIILELWTKRGVEVVEECWENLIQQDSKRLRSKRKRTLSKKPSMRSSYMYPLLDHLVETLSRAPFYLPIGVALQEFLSMVILKRHWEILPNIVSHLFGAFEIPNPFVKSSDDNPGMGYSLFSLDTTTTMVPRDDSKSAEDDSTNVGTTKKRSRDTILEKQQKKQRVLSVLNKTRLLSKQRNRITHFDSKMKDIYKLLGQTTSTPAPQHPGFLERKRNASIHASVVTPLDPYSQVTNRESGDQSARRTKNSVGPSNAIQESKKLELLTPPGAIGSHGLTNEPDMGSSSQLQRHLIKGRFIVGETPVKFKAKSCNPAIVESGTTTQLQSRSHTSPKGTTSNTSNSFLTNKFNPPSVKHDLILDTTTSSITKSATFRPVKLFGAAWQNKPRLAKDVKNEHSKSSCNGRSIQTARKLLRRKG
jgi:hypothetical protein